MPILRAVLAFERMTRRVPSRPPQAANPDSLPESLLEWELGWKPPVSMMGLMAAIFTLIFTRAWFTM